MRTKKGVFSEIFQSKNCIDKALSTGLSLKKPSFEEFDFGLPKTFWSIKGRRFRNTDQSPTAD